jgi:L-ascorbate metabolism protein UlaG (beta-lactamase superfamily)
MTYDFAKVPKASPALCLVTHGHRDHFDATLFARMDAKVIAPPELEATLPRERVIPFAPMMAWGDVSIEAFRTPHGTIDHRSYLVTWKGLRLYFTGDTDDTEALLAAKNLDVAFVSPWILGEVHEQGKRIDARRVIVYHHRPGETPPTFQNAIAPRQGDVLTLERPGS